MFDFILYWLFASWITKNREPQVIVVKENTETVGIQKKEGEYGAL